MTYESYEEKCKRIVENVKATYRPKTWNQRSDELEAREQQLRKQMKELEHEIILVIRAQNQISMVPFEERN